MVISTANSTSATVNSSKPESASSSSSATGSSMNVEDTQSRFLTLLVSQLRNQDPLNPLDNAQITSQIAQINTVGGIQQLNNTMNSLMQAYQSSQTLQATSLVGRGVLVSGNQITLSETGAMAGINLAEEADSVSVKIVDQSGKVVRTLDLGKQNAGSSSIFWDGAQDQGEKLTSGSYHLEVSAAKGGQPVEAKPLTYGLVEGVALEGSSVRVQVQGVGRLGISDLVQVLS